MVQTRPLKTELAAALGYYAFDGRPILDVDAHRQSWQLQLTALHENKHKDDASNTIYGRVVSRLVREEQFGRHEHSSQLDALLHRSWYTFEGAATAAEFLTAAVTMPESLPEILASLPADYANALATFRLAFSKLFPVEQVLRTQDARHIILSTASCIAAISEIILDLDYYRYDLATPTLDGLCSHFLQHPGPDRNLALLNGLDLRILTAPSNGASRKGPLPTNDHSSRFREEVFEMKRELLAQIPACLKSNPLADEQLLEFLWTIDGQVGQRPASKPTAAVYRPEYTLPPHPEAQVIEPRIVTKAEALSELQQVSDEPTLWLINVIGRSRDTFDLTVVPLAMRSAFELTTPCLWCQICLKDLDDLTSLDLPGIVAWLIYDSAFTPTDEIASKVVSIDNGAAFAVHQAYDSFQVVEKLKDWGEAGVARFSHPINDGLCLAGISHDERIDVWPILVSDWKMLQAIEPVPPPKESPRWLEQVMIFIAMMIQRSETNT